MILLHKILVVNEIEPSIAFLLANLNFGYKITRLIVVYEPASLDIDLIILPPSEERI
jgi:hypothetical protein